MIRHVIFDLDGTLLDTEGLYTAAAEQVCARYGATYTLELKRMIMGGDTIDGAQIVTRVLGLPIPALDYIAERERELETRWAGAQPMPGAAALIALLAARGTKVAIATSGHAPITRLKLEYHPFLSGLPVVCGDDPRLRRGKPAPDIFLLAAGELAADPSLCAVVEDSPNGIAAARAAGMRSIALFDPRWGYPQPSFDGALHTVHSLDEVTLEMLGIADSSQ